MRAIRVQPGLAPILVLLIGTAWAALWLWAQGPYGRYLDHGRWTEIGIAADICRALTRGDLLLPGLLYIGGWVLMTAAMMLPTVLRWCADSSGSPPRGRAEASLLAC